MTCIKTGFHAHLLPHDSYLYGDAFAVNGAYVFRICEVGFEPLNSVKHFTIHDYAHWFDEGQTSMAHNSTMICAAGSVEAHAYVGVPL